MSANVNAMHQFNDPTSMLPIPGRRRNVRCARMFYLPMVQAGVVGLGLTGVAGERKVSVTTEVQEPLLILGGTTDLSTSKATIKDGSGSRVWSNNDIRLKDMFGPRATARPWIYYKSPFLLRNGNVLRVDTLNVGPETGGNAVFSAIPVNDVETQVDLSAGFPYWLSVSLGLTGVASESKLAITDTDTRPIVVYGAASDLSLSSVRITDAERNRWSADFVPIWSLTGITQVIPALWPRPYLIPALGTLQIEVKNAASAPESNGIINFLCSKL